MNLKEGFNVDIVSIMMSLFVGTIIMFSLFLYSYSRKEDGAYQNLNNKLQLLEKSQSEQRLLLNSNIATIGSFNIKVTDLREFLNSVDDQVKLMNKKMCDQNEAISKKRSVIKIEQPLQFEVLTRGKGVNSLIRKTK